VNIHCRHFKKVFLVDGTSACSTADVTQFQRPIRPAPEEAKNISIKAGVRAVHNDLHDVFLHKPASAPNDERTI
jgi:hypothetical protein